MLRKTFSCSELCSRWNVNINDLTGIVREKNLRALNSKYEFVSKNEHGYFYRMLGNPAGGVLSPSPLPITDELGFYFNAADVVASEKENGITPHTPPASAQPQDELSDKKPVPKPRVALAYHEAAQLRREHPRLDKVKARNRINSTLKKAGYAPYSRTQFNRIIKDLNFPPAPRGRKPAK